MEAKRRRAVMVGGGPKLPPAPCHPSPPGRRLAGSSARPPALTWMRLSTLSCTMVGGLFLGRIVLTSTPSTKSWLATSTWKRCPQFLTQVSKTWRPGGAREQGCPGPWHACSASIPEERLGTGGAPSSEPWNTEKWGQCPDPGGWCAHQWPLAEWPQCPQKPVLKLLLSCIQSGGRVAL